MAGELNCRHLGCRDYADTARAMQAFTQRRTPDTPDQVWLLEHPPVYTQGQAGRPEHLLDAGGIPVVQANRGGQITYHGPGQLVGYLLLDLRRLGLGPRGLVSLLERVMIDLVSGYGVHAFARAEAPGIYVRSIEAGVETVSKLGSIGLRVSRGCSYHGLSINVDMDLAPFARINPCGQPGLRMTQLADLGAAVDVPAVAGDLCTSLRRELTRLRPAPSAVGREPG